jgi:putative flippase GtrA
MLTQDHPRISHRSAPVSLPSVPPVEVEVRTTPTPISAFQRPRAITLIRYLAVGACNTIFGYGSFALLTLILTPLFSYGYVIASLLANLFGITFAFLGYKWFVFKTRGNYLKEWVRCLGVYAGSMILSAASLPFVVGFIRRQPGHERSAPYIAGALVLVFSIVFSFFGHRHISFANGKQAPHNLR